MSMRVYNVPEEERKEALSFVMSLDIRKVANRIMQELFKSLAMRFEFELS